MALFAFRRLLRRRAIVNLTGGKAFAGILFARSGPLLILRDATLHEPGCAPVPVDGEVVIERSAVEFIQLIT
ncbi:hypothetical protein [Longispora albida]|uniref:hypothetical protein n=1 Tax=Longispora albida TaxID=203523 RepID=UPI000364A9C2|nr:hypothetical protein [Longispora albida]